jgi:hypothetical protein
MYITEDFWFIIMQPFEGWLGTMPSLVQSLHKSTYIFGFIPYLLLSWGYEVSVLDT